MLNYSHRSSRSWSMSSGSQRRLRSSSEEQEDETDPGIFVWLGKQFTTMKNGLRRRMTSFTVTEADEDKGKQEEDEELVASEETSCSSKPRNDSSSSNESSSSVPRSQPIDIRNARERDRSAERRTMNQALRTRHWKSFHCY